MLHRFLHRPFALVALAFLALGSCGDGTSSRNGRISLFLTDATGDVHTAMVTISEIYLQGSGGRVVLRDEPITTDLITLANSAASLVADAVVPQGTYSELRFVITGAFVEVENADGSTSFYATPDYDAVPENVQVAGELQMPSFASSGLKVKLPGDQVTVGEQKVMLVDFDVSQSFGHDTGADRWVMHPVIEAIEFVTSGTVNVTLRPDATVTLPGGSTLAGWDAKLSNAAGSTETLDFTDTDGDGTWTASFKFVMPGAWTVDLVAPAGVTYTTTPAHPQNVTLTSGGSATVAFTITTISIGP